MRDLVSPLLSPEAFQNHVHVYETVAPESGEFAENATLIEGKLKWANVEYDLSRSGRPLLALVAFDTLDSAYGDQSLDAMSYVLSSVRRGGDVFVGFVSPDSPSTAKLANLAKVVLNVETVNGCVLVYGDKPHTGLYNLSFEWSSGVPHAELRPVV